MVELELIYLGHIRVRAGDPVSIRLESLYANEWVQSLYANKWTRIRDDFHYYTHRCAMNGLTVAAKLLGIDLVAIDARLAIFFEKDGNMVPTLMLDDGRIIDWNTRNSNPDPASLPDRAVEMNARVAAAESANGRKH
jgi:hypothetical protein